MRNRGERRRKTDCVVQRRVRTVKHSWTYGRTHPFLKKPGRLKKYNLACGCEMCKLSRKSGKPEIKEPDES